MKANQGRPAFAFRWNRTMLGETGRKPAIVTNGGQQAWQQEAGASALW